MKLNKLAFTTMKPRNALAALALAGSLCALAPRAYADNDQGIDFASGGFIKPMTSIDDFKPNELVQVTGTCPQNGFLYAMASTEFTVFSSTPKVVQIAYSLSKTTSDDITTEYNLRFTTDGSVNVANLVASNPVMRLDSCSTGQSITYHFLAFKNVSNSSPDPSVSAINPKLVVTFFQNKI